MLAVQDTLKLTRHQQKLAKGIWKEWHEGLAQAKQDRQHILSEMQASGAAASMQRGMAPDMFSETSVLLEQAAALAENCVIQQEITLHCHPPILSTGDQAVIFDGQPNLGFVAHASLVLCFVSSLKAELMQQTRWART